MLSAIAGARQTITFESYVYWSGAVGRRFAEALIERARDGVEVHVMLDWVGDDLEEGALRECVATACMWSSTTRPTGTTSTG
jgi:cardiolipin synthase A/B